MSHNSTFSSDTVVVQLDEVRSTNDLAKQLVEKNEIQHATLIKANFQHNGRGQELNGWESEKGENILCSWVLKPNITVDRHVFLNITICLAVHDFVKKQLPQEQVSIKWPNDIYVNHSKIAGLLIENGIQGNIIKHAVIGMGININQLRFKTANACSLQMFTKHQYSVDDCVVHLLKYLKQRYIQLTEQDNDELWQQYHAVLYKKDIPSQFEQDGNKFTATPIGIDNAGRLKMLVNGELKVFHVKELIWS